jgi:importin-5
MLHGQLGSRVTRAVQMLLQSAGIDPTPLLQQNFSAEGQEIIKRHFS